jgi:hypothetical protein
MTIEIHIARNEDAKEWDELITKSPQSTLSHSWKWLRIAEKYTQSNLYPLIGMKKGNPVGVFPIFFQRKGPVRMVFSPPPNTVLFYLGPVLIGYDMLKQEKREKIFIEFLNSVENFIKNDLKAQYISISLSPSLKDPRPFLWQGYSVEPHYEYVVDLCRGFDPLFQSLGKRQRQNMNRARKRGIIVELGAKGEFEEILNLMDIRYAQQGKVVTPSKQYLLEIYNEYKDFIKIFVAKINQEIVTGSIDFQYKDTHYSWIGNPKPKKSITPSPNDLLINESVRYACEKGCRYYVTMGAAGDKRLHYYYASKFNPDLKIHYSLKKGPFFTELLEKSYTKIIKPLGGMIKQQH